MSNENPIGDWTAGEWRRGPGSTVAMEGKGSQGHWLLLHYPRNAYRGDQLIPLGKLPQEEREANTKLIAAAPKLAEAALKVCQGDEMNMAYRLEQLGEALGAAGAKVAL